jgi:hypothetical protein
MSRDQAAIIQSVLAKVDRFIFDLENGNIELAPEAKTLIIIEPTKGRLGQTTIKNKGSLLSFLGYAISDYKTSIFPAWRWQYAQECLKYIEWAYLHGVVIDKGMNDKLKSFEKENKQLKEQVNKLTELAANAISKTEDPYSLLFSLENKLRQFVSTNIKENKGVVDESFIKNWKSSKRKEALPPRKPNDSDLINFSTFDQLKKIIVQNENWERIFKRYFGRRDGVVSRINELDEIRDTIAHSRVLSGFDYDCFKTLYNQIMGCIDIKQRRLK